MTLTTLNSNVLSGVRRDRTITLPITDNTTITQGSFVELSSGKLINSISSLSSSLIGVAGTNKTMGVEATDGKVEYVGIVTKGVVKVRGLVEGSGGTYKTALNVGDIVSFHYDSTEGYGQFVVNSTSSPIGTIIGGSVASSGDTSDQTDYVLVQLDFDRSTANTNIAGSLLNEKHYIDAGSYEIESDATTVVVEFSKTLTATTGVLVFVQALTETETTATSGTLTTSGFTITGANSQTGNWFAIIPETSK